MSRSGMTDEELSRLFQGKGDAMSAQKSKTGSRAPKSTVEVVASELQALASKTERLRALRRAKEAEQPAAELKPRRSPVPK